jgi:hypothetical protein
MFNMVKVFRELFGSWVAAAPPRPKPCPSFKPMLEGLEERWCPSTIWNPAAGIQDGNNAANYTNGLPSANNPLILDGSNPAYNQPITFSAPLNIGSLTVQNGYANTLQINNNATLTTTAAGGSLVNSGCSLTILSADSSGFKLTNSGNFEINSGGALKLQDAPNAPLGGTFFAAGDEDGEAVVNFGTVTWTGTPGDQTHLGKLDEINVPVMNEGTFNANGGTGSGTIYPGRLYISGQWPSSGASFVQAVGSFNLTNLADVTVASGYYQVSGSLTSDATPATTVSGYFDRLKAGVGANGDINIHGGTVVVDGNPNSVGTLQFAADTVEIAGEIQVSGETLKGGNSKLCDVLDCGNATVTWEPQYGGDAGTIDISTTGSAPLGTGNQWVVMKYGEAIDDPIIIYPTGMNLSVTNTQIAATN